MTYCRQCGDVDDDDLTPKRCDCYCPECNENVWPTGVCTYCAADKERALVLSRWVAKHV